MVYSVAVFHRESNKRDTSRARRVVEEYAAVEVSLCEQEKTTSLTDGRQSIEVYKAKKNGPANNVGGNDSEVIPSKLSS